MIRPKAGAGARTRATLVVGAVEIESRAKEKLRLGRIRLAPIADFSSTALRVFIRANIVPGSTAKTDGLAAYLGAPGVTHEPHTIGSMAAHVVMPAIHRVFSNLKTWVSASITACAPSTRRPTSTSSPSGSIAAVSRHAAFATLLGLGVTLKPITYKMLISPGSTG